MKPTDEQLNLAMMEAMGWRKCTPEDPNPAPQGTDGVTDGFYSVTGGWIPYCRDYCTDRNLLPEMWGKLEQSGQKAILDYLVTLFNRAEEHLTYQSPLYCFNFFLITADPRLHIEATLRALHKWSKGWED